MTAPDPIALPADLEALLGAPVDTLRAARLIDMASELCREVVDPLPAKARPIVVAVAARAYVNGANVNQEMTGPQQVGFSLGGLMLTEKDERSLKRAAGRGGAFTVDPTPADAGEGLPLWSQNVQYLEAVPTLEDPW